MYLCHKWCVWCAPCWVKWDFEVANCINLENSPSIYNRRITNFIVFLLQLTITYWETFRETQVGLSISQFLLRKKSNSALINRCSGLQDGWCGNGNERTFSDLYIFHMIVHENTKELLLNHSSSTTAKIEFDF